MITMHISDCIMDRIYKHLLASTVTVLISRAITLCIASNVNAKKVEADHGEQILTHLNGG